jgi:uncharacterized protein (TIGR03435 family)
MKISEPIWKSTFFLAMLSGIGSPAMFAQTTPPSDSAPTELPKLTTSSGPELQYDVASVRQNLAPEPRWRMSCTTDGVDAVDVTLLYAIEEAYGVYDETLWSGIPPWIKEKRFDIKAKYDVEKYPHVTLEQRRAMLQQLLADRFKLVVHHETKEFPIYWIEVAKGGPKFSKTKTEDLRIDPSYGSLCNHVISKIGLQEMRGCSMEQLAHSLTGWTHDELGRQIVDRTGLSGRYSFSLNWMPDSNSASDTKSSGTGPSILTAVREQLGLLLKPGKGPLDTIVIDHVETPTEN